MKNESASLVGAFFRNRLVQLIVILDLIVVVVVVVLSIINSSRNAVVNFMVTPVDATIIVDGNGGYNNNDEAYYFTPGIHEIKIIREPLDEKILTMNLESGHNVTVATFLSQGGDFGFYELNENLASYERLAEIASASNNRTIDGDTSAEPFVDSMQKNFDLASKYLPLLDQTPTEYGFDAGVNYQYDRLVIEDGKYLKQCEKILCLYITDTSGEKEQYALALIKDFGFDVDLCQILYERVEYESL